MTENHSLSSMLHDATLECLTIDFTTASVTLSLRLCGQSARGANLVASMFTKVDVPRQQPWGPSVSVNGATIGRSPEGTPRLEVELQSGDVLLVEARSIDFVRDPEIEI